MIPSQRTTPLGLLPLPFDQRDFSHATVFGALKPEELPTEDFEVAEPLEIKDQADLDFCPAFAVAAVSEDQEAVTLSAYYQMAMIFRLLGNYKQWGSDLRTACQSAVAVGSLPESLMPFDPTDKSRDFLANWGNYPAALDFFAKKKAKKSYFTVDGPYDTFTNMMMTLWMNRAEKRSIVTGALWRDEWSQAPNGIIPEQYGDRGTPHAFKIFGRVTLMNTVYLKAQLSNGPRFGDGGIFYFPQAVVNKEFHFGAFTFRDLDPETASYYDRNGISIHDNWFMGAVKTIFNFFKK